MTAVNNEGLIDICKKCDCTGFDPVMKYEFDSVNNKLVLTEGSTFTSGDSFKNANIEVYDDFGNSIVEPITNAGGQIGINTATLDQSNGINIKVTICSVGGCDADGKIAKIGASGMVANWNKTSITSES